MKNFICCGLVFVLLSSCSARRVTIYCEPHNSAIYVNGEYQGDGIVNYNIPNGVKLLEISCSSDGINFQTKTFHTRGLSSTISLYLNESQKYSFDTNTITTY